MRKETYWDVYEKELLNNYLEYKGNIRVFVRTRPILPIDYRAYDGTRESFERIQSAMKFHNDQ